MNKNLRLLFAVTTAMLAVSCASPIERRLARNPEGFSKLPADQQSMVRSGRIKEGMTKDAVLIAWGRPNRVDTGTRSGKTIERWSYREMQPVFMSSFGMGFGGWGMGPCGGGRMMWGGPMMQYVPVPGPSVEFEGNRVTGYLVPGR
jgi:hypothetical protein